MKKIRERILFQGNWLALKEGTYLDDKGRESKWETVVRKHGAIFLVMIAKLVPSERYVLIKQYRPSIDNYIIGFPAGVPNSDHIGEEALRELKEETGYTGKVISISPQLKVNSGILNDSSFVVNVEIDETDPKNQNPQQSLEPSEEIEVVLKRKSEVKEFLLQEKERGNDIGAGVWYVFVNG